MKLVFFCPRWGSEDLTWDEFCRGVKAAGYDGVEAGLSFDEKEKAAQAEALAKHGLLFIGQYWQSFEKDFASHKQSYEMHLHHLASLRPLKIDAQTGKDYFTAEQNSELFAVAKNFTTKTGIVVAHETHRNKALFAAHITKNFLKHDPALSITADFSHWCAVAESFLEDQEEAIELATQHAVHIHARVGHPQGPQVIDPRLAEWQPALEKHLEWWNRILQHRKHSGEDQLTITTEFGPAPYTIHHPITKEPLANQWEINVWMKNFLQKRFC